MKEEWNLIQSVLAECQPKYKKTAVLTCNSMLTKILASENRDY